MRKYKSEKPTVAWMRRNGGTVCTIGLALCTLSIFDYSSYSPYLSDGSISGPSVIAKFSGLLTAIGISLVWGSLLIAWNIWVKPESTRPEK